MACGKCGAVVLAAGEARRFGSPKLLMPFGDSTVIGSVIHSLSCAGIAPIIAVAGASTAAIIEVLSDQPAQIICNPDPADGMISSVRIGVEALPASLDRFLIALGDQPRIRPEGTFHLVEEQIRDGKGIAIPTYQGKRGHPVVFSISYRSEILALTDQQTLRDIISACSDDIIEVSCDSDAYVSDIDTRKEYEHELSRWRAEQ